MTPDLLIDARPQCRLFHGFPDRTLIHMAPPRLAASRVPRKTFGRKHALPDPLLSRLRILPGEGRPYVNLSRSLNHILLINSLHPAKMFLQGTGKPLRQHGDPVVLPPSIPHHHLTLRNINIP